MLSRNSRFDPKSEPMTPLGKCYAKQSQGSSNGNRNVTRRRDVYEETYDFCQDVLREIKKKYDEAVKMEGPKTRVILRMNNSLKSMENKAIKIGIDPKKEIQENENNAKIKKKILSSIGEAKNLITLLEVTK